MQLCRDLVIAIAMDYQSRGHSEIDNAVDLMYSATYKAADKARYDISRQALDARMLLECLRQPKDTDAYKMAVTLMQSLIQQHKIEKTEYIKEIGQ